MNAAESPSSTVSIPAAPKLQLPAIVDPPSTTNPPTEKVWIVFGATGHMGRSLVRAALSHADKVTAVGHTQQNSAKQMTGWHKNCLGTLCDVRIRETVEAVIQQTISHWGRIDIVANCTGYGVVAAAEDQSQHDLANQFSTNFTGTLNILQLSLPYFRENSIPGRYLIFSSTSGALGVPGLAPYCATKYAVEGLIESMLYETDCFNIKATLVEPGYVRLDDTSNRSPQQSSSIPPDVSHFQAKQHSPSNPATTTSSSPEPLKRYGHFVVKPNPSPPYNNINSPSGHAKRVFIWFDKRQPTSAVRSAELLWQLGHCAYPPLRLLLGSYAVESIRDRLRSVIEEIEDWKWLSFPGEYGAGGVDAGWQGSGGAVAAARSHHQASKEQVDAEAEDGEDEDENLVAKDEEPNSDDDDRGGEDNEDEHEEHEDEDVDMSG